VDERLTRQLIEYEEEEVEGEENGEGGEHEI
jgi:hypothetical protein